MERRYLAYLVVVLSILTMSSMYLSWATERGYGTVLVEKYGTESRSGRPVNFTVYSPKTQNYGGLMPAVLTIHGASGTKEDMFAFNIELARRNFTVISIDLPGHGESALPFDLSNYTLLAEDCYAALQFARDRYSSINKTVYGVVGHSVGFQVGLAMYDLAETPFALVGVGPVWIETIEEYPGNLLLASGMYDEIVRPNEVLKALRQITDNDTAVAEVTYGSFEEKSAYRATFAAANHIGEATNKKIVEESVAWMISSLHGVHSATLPPRFTVYEAKTIGLTIGTLSFLVLAIPLFLLSMDIFPQGKSDVSDQLHDVSISKRKQISVDISLGVLIVVSLVICGYAGIGLESLGFIWIRGADLSGIGIFFVSYTVLMVALRRIGIGWNSRSSSLLDVRPRFSSIRNFVVTILRRIAPVLFCIFWLFGLVVIVSMPFGSNPLNTLMLLRFPQGQRMLNLVVLAICAVPFLWIDGAWIETLIRTGEKPDLVHDALEVLRVLAKRILPFGLFILAFVLGSLFLGVVGASSVLLGVLMVELVIGSAISTVLIECSAVSNRSLWPAILLGAFIIAWILATAAPLV